MKENVRDGTQQAKHNFCVLKIEKEIVEIPQSVGVRQGDNMAPVLFLASKAILAPAIEEKNLLCHRIRERNHLNTTEIDQLQQQLKDINTSATAILSNWPKHAGTVEYVPTYTA